MAGRTVREPPDLPDHDRRQLGRLVSEHGTLSRIHLELLATAGVLFVLFLGGWVALAHFAPRLFDPDIFRTLAWLLGLCSAFALAAFAYYLRFIPWRAYLYENGLAFQRGRKVEVIAWDEVDRMYERIRSRYQQPEHMVWLYLAD